MIEEFLVILAVCHTVIPEVEESGEIYYNAASPDEKALVLAAAQYGYVFESRNPESVTIRFWQCLRFCLGIRSDSIFCMSFPFILLRYKNV